MGLLSRQQIASLKDSFEWFAPCGAAMIARVMRNLADNHPGIRAMFPEETAELNSKLFSTLGQIVANINRFDKLEGPLGELGKQCAVEGVNVAHYRIVGDELLSVMAELARDDWNKQLERDWEALLSAVTGAMLAGAVIAEREANEKTAAGVVGYIGGASSAPSGVHSEAA